MQILELSDINVFFSLAMLIFYEEHCQTLFLIDFAEKSEGKQT